MSKFQFIHSADLHLDSPLTGLERYEGAPVDEIRLATRRAFENVVQLAIDRAVDFFLIAGDVYDGDWKDYQTGLFFAKQMVRLKQAEIPVFAISGNHDAANKMTRAVKLPDNVTWFSHERAETVQLDSLDVAIHGRSFANQAETDNLAIDYPDHVRGKYNIGLLHTSLEGSQEHASYAPCTLDDLRSRGYDYWALGHIHTRDVVCEDPFVVFPGNPQGRHIGETGIKGVYLVSVDERGNAELEFCPTDVMRWERLELQVDSLQSYEEIFPLFRDSLQALVGRAGDDLLAARVRIIGRTSLDSQLRADQAQLDADLRAAAMEVGSGRVWIEKIKVQSHPEAEALDGELDGPLAEIEATLNALKSDDAERSQLVAELEDLVKKLPSEMTAGRDAFRLENDESLNELLDQAYPLVMARLKKEPN